MFETLQWPWEPPFGLRRNGEESGVEKFCSGIACCIFNDLASNYCTLNSRLESFCVWIRLGRIKTEAERDAIATERWKLQGSSNWSMLVCDANKSKRPIGNMV